MYKTFKDLKVIAKHIDLSIIVLDARAPKATMNDMFNSIFVNSKKLYIFNKIDLCDKSVLANFINQNKKKHINYLKTSL
ncbi:MAG: ribosome biogenesis GTPase YlqF, partial [Mycoplasma sp.]|nr:ribosome biogenesis GTPase YlqF [Mycoplasma sp.]